MTDKFDKINVFNSGMPVSPAFQIGDFQVQWYGIFFALGILTAVILITLKLRLYHKVDDTPFYIYVFMAVPSIILGARMWSFIIGDSVIGRDPFFNFSTGFSGLAIQGSVLFTTLVGLIWFGCILGSPKYYADTINPVIRKGVLSDEIISRRISMWVFSDTIIPAILIGQAIGRWGNFFNHEVYGQIVQEAIYFDPQTALVDPTGAAFTQWGWLKTLMPLVWENMWIKTGNIIGFRVPIFLIESFMNVIVFLVLYYCVELIKGYRAGTLCFSYFFSTGLIRLIIELFRDDQYKFDTSIYMSIIFMIVGFVGIILCYLLFPRLRNNRCIYRLCSSVWIHLATTGVVIGSFFKYLWLSMTVSSKYAAEAKTKNKQLSRDQFMLQYFGRYGLVSPDKKIMKAKPYKTVYEKFDTKRKANFECDFFNEYYYNDNISVKPYVVN